jgi:hypothetical protein
MSPCILCSRQFNIFEQAVRLFARFGISAVELISPEFPAGFGIKSKKCNSSIEI